MCRQPSFFQVLSDTVTEGGVSWWDTPAGAQLMLHLKLSKLCNDGQCYGGILFVCL